MNAAQRAKEAEAEYRAAVERKAAEDAPLSPARRDALYAAIHRPAKPKAAA